MHHDYQQLQKWNAALAQDFDKGVAAARTGDYASALEIWKPLAEQGDAEAQYGLGLSYAKGEGVPQDYIKAHMWYNIAAANWHDEAGEWRSEIAEKMTPADISKARSMAKTCMESGYKGCD